MAIQSLIIEKTRAILADKGERTALEVDANTRFLGAELPFDSLDLATLIVTLEEETGLDPFRAGFRDFATVGDLAALYEATAAEAGVS